VGTKFEPQIDPTAVPWYRDENYQILVNAGVVGGIFLLVLLTIVMPMVRRLTTPPVDTAAIAAAAAAAAAADAQMAIDVATAESVAAQTSAKMAKEAHEAELARVKAEAEKNAEMARVAAEQAANAPEADNANIELKEGETLDEVKARMASLKPKKQSISADLLNTANSYDDKVALIRMIVSEDSTRVAGVLKSLIRPTA
jgi:flagellar M-ring protein FliF